MKISTKSFQQFINNVAGAGLHCKGIFLHTSTFLLLIKKKIVSLQNKKIIIKKNKKL